MQKTSLAILFAAVMALGSMEVAAQSLAKRFMLGMEAGAQRLYGDSLTSKFGIGGEGHLGYRLTGRLGATLVGGYASFPYTLAGVSTQTNIFYGHLLLDFELLNKGKFHPYLLAGAGTYNYRTSNGSRKIEPSGIGGLGVRWMLGHKMALDINSTYHFASSDRLDAILKSGNDRYFSGRIGFSYFTGSSKNRPPKEELFSEFETETPEMGTPMMGSAPEEMKMEMPDSAAMKKEEYARLKSKIDELKQSLESKESEISTLTSTLAEKREQTTQVQNTMETPPPQVSGNGNVSAMYQQALNKYYMKSYREAVQMFTDLASQFPNHSLTGNFHYWIGEAQYQLGNYQDAVTALNRVFQYPQSPKQDDALLMLGKCYAQINLPEEARKVLTRLIEEFPSSEYVNKAEALLARR